MTTPDDALQPGPAPRRRGFPSTAWVPPALSAVLLLAVTAYGFTLPSPGDAEAFHGRILAMQTQTPLRFGEWSGRDAHIADEAITLLRPNVLISRQYTHAVTGERASFLLVQCKDSRYLNGHWPPNCYPANGYAAEGIEPDRWTVGGQTFPGYRYTFSKPEDGYFKQTVVANFLLLPDGRVTPDMSVVIDAGGDYRLRYYGAAQVQVLTDGQMTETRRREVIEAFIGAYLPMIDALRSADPGQAPPDPSPR